MTEKCWIKLYAQLTGNPNATYDNVVSAAQSTRNSEDFYNQNSNKAITLTIDNKVWSAMYLSTNNDGDPILTLWLASSTETAQWNAHAVNANANVPSNMYGTSMIRAITLNNGGTYYTSNSGSGAQTVAQDPSKQLCKIHNGRSNRFIDGIYRRSFRGQLAKRAEISILQ